MYSRVHVYLTLHVGKGSGSVEGVKLVALAR